MANYASLSKLGRVQLPGGGIYALIDVNGRLMLAENYLPAQQYEVGQFVVFTQVNSVGTSYDGLYKCISRPPVGVNPAHESGSNYWQITNVANELQDIRTALAGGVHFVGYTTTVLFDGSTASVITINGAAHTAAAGDLVIQAASTYEVGVAYEAGEYITWEDSGHINHLYKVEESITAANNTGINAVVKKEASSNPEFIFDGTRWYEVGSLNPAGLKALAFKDTATGEYTKPTGSGSVTITTVNPSTTKLSLDKGTSNANIAQIPGSYSANTSKLATTSIYGVESSTETAVYLETETATNVATVGTTVSNVPLTFGTNNFNTDAIKSATCSQSFVTSGITGSVDDDMLVFTAVTPTAVSISTAPATTASAYNSVATKTDITPAGTSTTIIGIKDNTYSSISGLAKKASGTTTVATGSLTSSGSGADVATGITAGANINVFKDTTTLKSDSGTGDVTVISSVGEGTTSATVSVGTTTDSVTVR